MDILAAFSIAGLWSEWVWPVLLLVFGFGFVVFIHELGHFMSCKMVGIQVERFAIGFGPRMFGFKRGDTDYCFNLLPLGGYVKMLGQEDFSPLKDAEAENPKSFNSKSIRARLLVVSAGVIMNIVLAAILFVVVCLAGIRFIAPVVGGISPGSAAAEAKIVWSDATGKEATTQPTTSTGLKAGDRIVELNGRPVGRFNKLAVAAVLAGRDEKFEMIIERPVDGGTRKGTATVGVKMNPSSGRLIFGIAPPVDTVFADFEDYLCKTPFRDGDRLVAINGKEIQHFWDIKPIIKNLDSGEITITIDRDGEKISAKILPQPYTDAKKRSKSKNNILRNTLDVLGLIPRVKVAMVEKGSRADKAGLKPADVIVGYADRGAPSLTQLHELNTKFAGEGTNIVVLRDGKKLPPFRIVPKNRNGKALIGIMAAVDAEHPVIADVRKGSLCEKAGIRPGDTIEKFNSRDIKTWNDLVVGRKAVSKGKVTIIYRRGVHTLTATIADVSKADLKGSDYRFSLPSGVANFKRLYGDEIKKNPLAAIAWGTIETGDFIVMTYATLRGLIGRTVSPSELRGPVGIVEIGIQVGRKSFIEMLYFLAMISVSLAVINFLPIPVVDGGLAVFLIVEKIRGKPLSLKVMNIIQMIGIALLLFAFVAITWQDIARLVGRMW